MADLNALLTQFTPYNEQEEKDRALFLTLLKQNTPLFDRQLPAHFTSSAWVIDHTKNNILLAYHNLYNAWAWLGGHADGERDLLKVALKEVKEESGLQHVEPLSENIFSVETLTVNGHEKRQAYVPSHLHLNVTFLLTADQNQPLSKKEDENSDVQWFPLEKAVQKSSEKWMRTRIYQKLNEKLQSFL